MNLVWLIVIPIAGGILAWLSASVSARACRWISLFAMLAQLGLALGIWVGHFARGAAAADGAWLARLDMPWIPSLGIDFRLGLDGLSLILVLLTAFLGIMSVGASWKEIREREGFHYFCLLCVLAGITGVFLSLDLFLFYFFWELMLVPMYLLIAIWGHERRVYAAIKFFLFTQLSGLLMLLAIVALYYEHGRSTGHYTFDYFQLLGTKSASATASWMMLGFFIAFAVKLPVFPVHTWLPDAHTEAPTAGSVVLAGLLLKTGAYGMLRFVLPLFPAAAAGFAPFAELLGVIGILYGGVLSFAQTDFKRLVAYTSVSHMGFVLLGVFAGTELALQGAVLQIVCHGISTGALFLLAGVLQERLHTREMARMGGLWSRVPLMGGVAMFFAMASLGLPGLGNFVAEFLVLLGTYQVNVPMAVAAGFGLLVSVVYSLWMMRRVFQGPVKQEEPLADLDPREQAMMAVMIVAIVWLGIYPQPLLRTAWPTIEGEAVHVGK